MTQFTVTMRTVSVIVTAFNQEKFIADTIESVLRQRYPDWECIVVDDGSTDRTLSIINNIARTDDRIRVISKSNGGVASARNAGMACANGKYLLPLDGDDRLHKDYLVLAVEHFKRYPETALVYCRARRFGQQHGLWRLPAYSWDKLLWQNMIFNSAVFTRERFVGTRGYCESLVSGFEDWDLYIRMLDRDAVVHCLPQAHFFYRIKQQSRSTEQMKDGRIEQSLKQIFEHNLGCYDQALANPLKTFADRLVDFKPDMVGKIKRQRDRLHLIYLLVLVIGTIFAYWAGTAAV